MTLIGQRVLDQLPSWDDLRQDWGASKALLPSIPLYKGEPLREGALDKAFEAKKDEIIARITPILKIHAPSMTRFEILRIAKSAARFLVFGEGKGYRKKTCKPKLARTMENVSKDEVYLHLNRQVEKDLVKGRGTFNKASFSLNVVTGELVIRLTRSFIPLDKKTNAPIFSKEEWVEETEYEQKKQAAFIQKHLRDVDGVVKIYRSTTFTSKDGFKKTEILMPFYEGGDLFDAIYDKKLTYQDKIKIFAELLSIVSELQDKNVIHRDLKPENIFLTKDKRPIIADFGFACLHNTERLNPLDKVEMDFERAIFKGTPDFMAPEYLAAKENPLDLVAVTTPKIDDYALARTFMDLFKAENAAGTLNPEIKKVISGLGRKDPSKRISVKDALKRLQKII